MLWQKLLGGTAGAAGIELVSSSTVVPFLTSITNVSFFQPLQANDLLLVYYGAASTTNLTLTVNGNDSSSPYNILHDLYANDTYDANLTVAWRVMPSTPDFRLQLSPAGSGNGAAALIFVFRGVDPANPFDVTSTTATGTNSVLCNPPAITPITNGALIVAGGVGAHNNGTKTFTSSDLDNFATRASIDTNNESTIGAGLKEWTSGAFDPAAFGFSGTNSTSYSWAAVTLALRPA
jgi:hypothetical protein